MKPENNTATAGTVQTGSDQAVAPSTSCYAVRIPNRDKLSYPPEGSKVFEVQGAGWLAFGGHTEALCGTAHGCCVDNSWTEWGYSGGVMDRKEMERLRDHLTELLEHNS